MEKEESAKQMTTEDPGER